MRTYSLPLAVDYVGHWGVVEAIRELLQNAIDSDSPFVCQFDEENGFLRINSRDAKLEPKTLLLGTTTKRNDNSKIGSFGEGYKLALLVLSREGKNVVVLNNNECWTPRISYSETFDCQQLFIDTDSLEGNQGLSFDINGLTKEEISSIKASCLELTPFDGEVIKGLAGDILVDLPGKLYVNGLFVCETKLKHSYNFKPEYLELERDRQTVNDFNLKWQTGQLWAVAKKHKKLAEMISNGDSDVTYTKHTSVISDETKNYCYQTFISRNPNCIIAENQQHKNKLELQGYNNVIVAVSETEYSAVSSAPLYKARGLVMVHKPKDLVKVFFDKNKQYMRRHAIVATKQLLAASENWT